MKDRNKVVISSVKLVIWDLDETFWQGTLDDGDSVIIPKINIDTVKTLTDYGIVNSVCSKNDKTKAENVLANNGILDYFVFNSIDWTPKGQRIKSMLTDMGLRPVNVLFIDDNHLNLEEVEFSNPGIMTAYPDIIPSLLDSLNTSDKKKDETHKRLNQYKVLQTKVSEKEKFGSNKEFLKSSQIKVDIHLECKAESSRIQELVMRSNQLNFTKIRSSQEEINSLIDDDTITKGTVHVKDRFGEYGMVGFFAIKDGKAIHFLFSCRTIGMGIEQYVYHKLNCPLIDIVGEVVSDLSSSESLEWINQDDNSDMVEDNHSITNSAHSILFKGPCDMEQIFNFIKANDSIDAELTYVNSKGISIQGAQHILHIKESITLSETQKTEIIGELPFADSDFFSTKMFSGNYHYVFLSTLHDSHLGIYKRKKDGAKVVFGEAIYPLTDKTYWDDYVNQRIYTSGCKLTIDFLEWFSENYEFCGITQPDELRENILFIKEHLPKETKLILLLGVEKKYANEENAAFLHSHEVFKVNNQVVKELKQKDPSIEYISYEDNFEDGNDFYMNSYHFQPQVYYNVAKKICAIVTTDGSVIGCVNESKVKFSKLRNAIRHNFFVDKLIEFVRLFVVSR